VIELRLPDFIVAGAPRCGTTWLYAMASRHPQIEMAKPATPEPKFFLRDDLFAQGLTYYSETWFANIPRNRVAGEKSTNYLESPFAARRIHDCLPLVRLVFMLRNPIHRAFSNYLWSRQNGLESRSFDEALNHEEEREQRLANGLRYARPHALFSRGLYADLLRPYFNLFPRERILVMRYEDILASPTDVATQLHRFLGVPPRPGDAEHLPPLNASVHATESIDPRTYDLLAARYAEPNGRLADLLGWEFQNWDR
jgi:hypothetical protein